MIKNKNKNKGVENMKKILIDIINQKIKSGESVLDIMESLGNNNYCVYYDEKGFVYNIKKAILVI